MFTIDEIRIEGEEDGFHLIVYPDDADPIRYRIGLPDQFHAEVERTIGRWLDEGEAARATMLDDDGIIAVRSVDDPMGPPRVLLDYDLARDIERGK